jgi:hypothetical protein
LTPTSPFFFQSAFFYPAWNIASAAYGDQTAQAATTYHYVVTASNTQGQESAHSSEAKVGIP